LSLVFYNLSSIFYIIKELVQPKNSLSNREFLIWKERGRGGRERGWASRQAYLRLG
jgi:hypothetical protein